MKTAKETALKRIAKRKEKQEKFFNIDFYKRRSEFYKKKIKDGKLQLAKERVIHIGEMRSLRNLQEEQLQVLESENGRL